jgi:hypothetical protein
MRAKPTSTKNRYEMRLEAEETPAGEVFAVLPNAGAAITLADKIFVREILKMPSGKHQRDQCGTLARDPGQ